MFIRFFIIVQDIESLIVGIPIRLIRTGVRMAKGKALKQVRTEKTSTSVTHMRIILSRVLFYICIAEIDGSSR
jgi:hypothetical protein